jgi:hypothetical protein
MKKRYLIRFNTNAQGDENCWRILDGDQEILVDSIEIKTHSYTSKDYIENVGLKYHIACEGHLQVENGVATISD